MRRNRRRPAAFTLVEALVAISFTALAGSALLLGTVSSLQTTHYSQDETVALGMAQQLMDEVMGNVYLPSSGNPYASPIKPGASQVYGVSRQYFNDIGAFNGYRCQPPVDPYGIALGTDNGAGAARPTSFQAPAGLYVNWRQEVDVYYVGATNLMTALAGSQTSDYRAVETRINYVDPATGQTRLLAQLRRVVTYVPPLP